MLLTSPCCVLNDLCCYGGISHASLLIHEDQYYTYAMGGSGLSGFWYFVSARYIQYFDETAKGGRAT
jgi:hypothetical protein